MRVGRVEVNLTIFVRCLFIWACEAVRSRFLFLYAILTAGDIGPDALARIFVEVKAVSALALDVNAVVACDESIALSFVGMAEDAVLSGTEFRGRLCRLQFRSLLAVDLERMVAFEESWNVLVEDQTIGTELRRRDPVHAFVIFVTLFGVCEKPSFLCWTLKATRC